MATADNGEDHGDQVRLDDREQHSLPPVHRRYVTSGLRVAGGACVAVADRVGRLWSRHRLMGIALAVAAVPRVVTNLHNVVGDHGHGHGIWQLDDRSHRIPPGFDRNPEQQARTAAEMLHNLHNRFHSWEQALNAYNSGRPDATHTTGHNYGPDVLNRLHHIDAIEHDPAHGHGAPGHGGPGHGAPGHGGPQEAPHGGRSGPQRQLRSEPRPCPRSRPQRQLRSEPCRRGSEPRQRQRSRLTPGCAVPPNGRRGQPVEPAQQ